MANATSGRVGEIADAQSPAKAQSARESHDNTASQSSRIHVSVLPISRRPILFRSVRSLSHRYAVFREHPTWSATSAVPATPPSSRRASRKSSSDHEGVYWPVLSSRSGGTDCVLMPLSYGAYGIIVPPTNTTENFITLTQQGHGANHRSLGAYWRARMIGASGPGFALYEPMTTNGQSSLERAAYDAVSPVTTSRNTREREPIHRANDDCPNHERGEATVGGTA